MFFDDGVVAQVFTGHQGFTPTETAFYLYSDVSRDLVTSGSESGRGCIWDRTHGCLVASLQHDACVNSVAICPTDQVSYSESNNNNTYFWILSS